MQSHCERYVRAGREGYEQVRCPLRMETVLVSGDSNEEDFTGFTEKDVRFEEGSLDV
jgi:hypothetical protein